MKTSFSSWTKNWSPSFWQWHHNWDAKSTNFQICTTLHQTNKTFYSFKITIHPPIFLINPVASISHTRMIKKYAYALLYYIISCLLFCIISVPDFFIFHKNLFIMLYIVIYYCWRMYYCNYLLCEEHPCKLLYFVSDPIVIIYNNKICLILI